MSLLIYILLTICALFLILSFYLIFRFKSGKKKIEQEWLSYKPEKITNLGKAKYLEILPLIDWYTNNDKLIGEAGVSYFIKTNEAKILFDVGYNARKSDPSPLLHNMGQLNLSMDDFDVIVISHNHLDHVGGFKWQKKKSFSLTTKQIDLGNKTAYTPIPMTYPGMKVIHSKEPTKIAEGISTIGVIPNFDFFMGRIDEQALAVNIEGKGVVIISGCGHQTLPKIIERTKALFDDPIYGIIGGLHYPVSDSRVKKLGLKMQKIFGTCRPPRNPITMDDVKENIALLKKINPRLVALSAHDSCDVSIETFRNAFPNEYKEIKVGDKIIID